MNKLIEFEPIEVREWLEQNPDWEFCGAANHISHLEMTQFVNDLYKAGCKSIVISDYYWEIEPVYEDDEFHPNMLIIHLPIEVSKRQKVLNIVNHQFAKLTAKHFYKDSTLDKLWYFFEPEPNEITVGTKKIIWYT